MGNNILLLGAIAIGGIAAWFLLGKPTSIEGIQAGISGLTESARANYTVSRGGGYGGGMSVSGPGFVMQRGGGPGGGVSYHGVAPPPPGLLGSALPIPTAALPIVPSPIDSIRGGIPGAVPFSGGAEYGMEGQIGKSPYANPSAAMGDGLALSPFVGGIGTSPFTGGPFLGSIGAPGGGVVTSPYGLPPPIYGGHLRHGGYEFGGRMSGYNPGFLNDYSHPYQYLSGPPAPYPVDFPPPYPYPAPVPVGPRPGPWYNNPYDRRLRRSYHPFRGRHHDHDHDRGFLGNLFGGIFGH
jgi:hypothetical protein